ncbi:MAG: ABC transporter ATP-binding protein, partial [Erysipelotrichia bacterium]|nr:ABC transporter ATP-binding protein [Erysipelotrichia bacterium]
MSNTQVRKAPRGPMGAHGPMGSGRPGEKAKDFKGTMRQLLKYLGRYQWLLFIAIIFAIGSTIIVIIGPDILGDATTLLANGLSAKAMGSGSIDFDGIFDIIIQLVGLYIFSMVCGYVQGFIMATIAQKTSYNLRKELSEKINHLPLSYFDKTSQGDVLSRVTNDIDTIGMSLNQSLAQVISSIVQVLGVAFMMIKISWIMSLVAFCVLPVSGILIMLVTKRSQKYFVAQQRSLGLVNGHVEEMYGGHTIVKAFNGEKDSLAQFNEYNDQLYNSAWKSQFLSGLMQPITQFIGNIGYVFVVLVGGILATHSQ